MRDWAVLLRTPRFRALWIALLCNNLSSWCVMAALPILVAQKYGAGTELVLSLGLRILPKHANARGIAHGGLLMTLCDIALG